MKSIRLQPVCSLKGELTFPGDKSISHRALIFAALAEGRSTIQNLLLGEDVLCTLKILQQLGVCMSHKPHELKEGDILTIEGRGLLSLKPSNQILHCGNSGTTMRLMLGLLSAQPFESTLTGDPSLNRRPMDRVMEPLTKMGARFEVGHGGGRRLITVRGSRDLKGGNFVLPVASAQLKSALLLAGLYAQLPTNIWEPAPSRDHTERMLEVMGASLRRNGLEIEIKPTGRLNPNQITVPGDFSSAAFFLVAGLLVPKAKIILKAVGVNPTRNALLSVLQKMGGKIILKNERMISGEPVSDLEIANASLGAASLEGAIIPNIIDEIPIFAIAASRALGTSVVKDAKELRVKESDRIAVIVEELKKLGVGILEKEDGFIITGPAPFKGGTYPSHGDHRMAMSLAIASLVADGPCVIEDIDCVETSFPGFFEKLNRGHL